MKRTIKYLVVHCTATPPEAKVENIVRYWKEQKRWKNPGYHYIIRRNGEIVQLLSEDLVANGVKNNNQPSIHISYIGGIDGNNKPLDNRTPEQKKALYLKLRELASRFPLAEIKGHRDFPGVTKACPSFDVKTWLRDYTPD